jgi:hypothetical protein
MRDLTKLDNYELYDELNGFDMRRINLTPVRNALIELKEYAVSVLVDGVSDPLKSATLHAYVKMRNLLKEMKLDGCEDVPHYADLMALLYLVDLNDFAERPRTHLYRRRMARLGSNQEDCPLF